MRLKFSLGFILLLAVVAPPARPQDAAKPLNKNQVLELVKAGMDSAKLAEKVKQLGIDFDLTEDFLQALRQAGAQDVLIQALRAARPKPLTRDQVLALVAGHVPSQRATALVKQHGIDFLPDEEYLGVLRVAGAQEELLAALHEAAAAATGKLVVKTSPNAQVYVDGELRGRVSAQGELVVQSKLGVHMLKVTLTGWDDFQQSVTVAGVQGTTVEAQPRARPGPVRKNPLDGLPYVWIPPGTFMMGCSPGDSECANDEKPAHAVTISKGFWIGQTETTVGAYKRFSEATRRQMPPEPKFMDIARPLNPAWGDEAMPIVNVAWDDAQAFCSWAGGRLPREAEWEYAARGGSTALQYGDLDEVAWYAENSGRQRLDFATYLKRGAENGNTMHPVGQKRANGFGLFDVLGNVWEWVNDWYDEKYYQTSSSQDPSGPTRGEKRVLRGGAWDYQPSFVRVSFRFRNPPEVRVSGNGVRCVWEGSAP